jgi:hypothetical protein
MLLPHQLFPECRSSTLRPLYIRGISIKRTQCLRQVELKVLQCSLVDHARRREYATFRWQEAAIKPEYGITWRTLAEFGVVQQGSNTTATKTPQDRNRAVEESSDSVDTSKEGQADRRNDSFASLLIF